MSILNVYSESKAKCPWKLYCCTRACVGVWSWWCWCCGRFSVKSLKMFYYIIWSFVVKVDPGLPSLSRRPSFVHVHLIQMGQLDLILSDRNSVRGFFFCPLVIWKWNVSLVDCGSWVTESFGNKGMPSYEIVLKSRMDVSTQGFGFVWLVDLMLWNEAFKTNEEELRKMGVKKPTSETTNSSH